MGGAPTSIKYVIYAKMEIKGLVDKHDIVGAIFGQTEGLLGDELDIRELQKTGRLGRIEVKIDKRNNHTVGYIEIPSNLDRVETALIAAAIEMIDRVGPYAAKTTISRIEDVRAEKRKKIIARAIEILKRLEEEIPETKELTEEVLKSVRSSELKYYGHERLPAGPDIDRTDTIIIVEGRADVINLLRHGYRNVIAIGGAIVPKTIIELSKRKNAILFVDGDRGGELIARNVVNVADIDYIARAPPGREVEELTGKEIAKALRNKIPVEEFLETIEKERKQVKEVKAEIKLPSKDEIEEKIQVKDIELPPHVMKSIEELRGTLEAILYDNEWKEVLRVPVRDLATKLQDVEKVSYIIFDGIITQRVLDIAYSKGIKILIGARIGDVIRIPEGVKITTFDKL